MRITYKATAEQNSTDTEFSEKREFRYVIVSADGSESLPQTSKIVLRPNTAPVAGDAYV